MADHHQELLHRNWQSHREGSAESDVLLAARQLMHLSDEENSGVHGCCRQAKQKRDAVEPSVYRSMVMEQLFGGEEEIHWMKKRRRRFRDIADLYTVTEPVTC